MHTRTRVLGWCSILVAVLSVVSSSSAQDKKAPKVDKAVLAEQASAIKMMDDVFAGQAAPSDFTFSWVNHSMKSRDNKMYVPFILTFDPAKPLPANATYYLRVVNKATIAESLKKVADHKAAVEKAANLAKLDPENTELADAEAKLRAEAPKIEYAFEDMRLGQSFTPPPAGKPFRFAAALAAPAGDYDVYVLFKEPQPKDKKLQPKAAVLKVPLVVPNYWTDDSRRAACSSRTRLNSCRSRRPRKT